MISKWSLDESESDWFKRARASLLSFVMSQSKNVQFVQKETSACLVVPFETLESCYKTTTYKDVNSYDGSNLEFLQVEEKGEKRL